MILKIQFALITSSRRKRPTPNTTIPVWAKKWKNTACLDDDLPTGQNLWGNGNVERDICHIWGCEIAGGHHEIVAAAAEAVRQFRRLLGADRDCRHHCHYWHLVEVVKFLLLTRTIPECRRIFALSVILWQKYKRRKFDWSANRLYTLAWRRYCRFEKAGLWSRFQKVRDECWLSPRKTVKNGKEIRPKRIFTVYTTNLITGIYVKIKMVRPQGIFQLFFLN